MLAHSRHRAARAASRNRVSVGLDATDIRNNIFKMVKKKYGTVNVDTQRKMFDLYDANKDGRLTRNELIKLLDDADSCHWLAGCGPVADEIIKQVDSNKDKGVSWEEYAKVAKITLPPKPAPTPATPTTSTPTQAPAPAPDPAPEPKPEGYWPEGGWPTGGVTDEMANKPAERSSRGGAIALGVGLSIMGVLLLRS